MPANPSSDATPRGNTQMYSQSEMYALRRGHGRDDVHRSTPPTAPIGANPVADPDRIYKYHRVRSPEYDGIGPRRIHPLIP